MNKTSLTHKALLCLLMLGASSVTLQAHSAALLMTSGASLACAVPMASFTLLMHSQVKKDRQDYKEAVKNEDIHTARILEDNVLFLEEIRRKGTVVTSAAVLVSGLAYFFGK